MGMATNYRIRFLVYNIQMKKSPTKNKNKKESYRPSPLLIRSIKQAEKEFKAGKLKFYNGVDELMKALNS